MVDAGNQHYRAADVMNTEQVINFTIRYRSGHQARHVGALPGREVGHLHAGRVFVQAHLSGPEGVAVEGSERMRQVQEALKGIGIPVMAGVWRATSANQNPPVQYAVYPRPPPEASHQDDHVTSYRTFVYLNLWSDIDPTERQTASARPCTTRGFFMVEESDKGIKSARLRHRHYAVTVQWTWCWREEVKPNAPLKRTALRSLMTDIAGMARRMDADGSAAPVAKRILEAAQPIHQQMKANATKDHAGVRAICTTR